MTPREDLLRLYRREGYRFAPVEMDLCPSLWKQYQALADDTPMAEYFAYPEGFQTS